MSRDVQKQKKVFYDTFTRNKSQYIFQQVSNKKKVKIKQSRELFYREWKKKKEQNANRIEKAAKTRENNELETRKVKVFNVLKKFYIQQYKEEQEKKSIDILRKRTLCRFLSSQLILKSVVRCLHNNTYDLKDRRQRENRRLWVAFKIKIQIVNQMRKRGETLRKRLHIQMRKYLLFNV